MVENLSREYLSCSPEDREAFRDQLAQIYKRPAFVIVGSIGRQAMYASYGWNVEALTLRTTAPYRNADGGQELGELRDIDAVRPLRKPDRLSGKHDLDTELDTIFPDRDLSGLCEIWAGPVRGNVPIDKRTLRSKTRLLDGMPVRTFEIGTQLHFDQFVKATLDGSSEKQPQYDRSLEVFGQFAAAMREQHPEEFLSPEYYGPFQVDK